MVRLDDSDSVRQERERQRLIEEAKKNPKPNINKADAYIRGIFGVISGNEQILTALIKGSNEDFLEVSSKMSDAELAGDIAFFVAFSLAGRVGNKLGEINSKGGKTTSFERVSQFAKSKGFKLAPDIKPKVNSEINRVNQLGDSQQQEGLLRIRESKLQAAQDLLKNITDKTEKFKLKADIEGIKRSITQGAKDLADSKLNEEVSSLNKLDPKIQFKIENGRIVKALSEQEKTVEDLNKEGGYLGKYKYKIENGEIVIDRPKASEEAEQKLSNTIDENIRQAQQLIEEGNRREQLAKEAREKAKAEDKAIDEDPDFDEKGEPDGDKVIETKEKTDVKDKPDFSDEAKETDPLMEREQTTEEMIDESIERNRQEGEASSKVKTAAKIGGATIIATEVAESLTRQEEDPRRRRNFELDEIGFTDKPVVEGEEGTQSINEPTPAPKDASANAVPAQAQATISFINHKEKRTQTTENIDELFSITIKVCTDVYDNKIGEEKNYYYFGNFDVPVLFFVSQKILYIGFRGTDSISNVITDLQTAEVSFLKNNTNSNYLNRHEPFNKILDPIASNIEFFLGVILQLKQSYRFIVDRIKDIDHSINSIVVTGHSLGGAMAQLFTYVYNNSNEDKYDKIPIKHTVTYGQPRILFDKPEYITLFNDSVRGYHRVWNTLDPIPYLPFKKKILIDKMLNSNMGSGYTHVGDSFDLAGNIVNNDVNLLLYEILKGNKEKIEMLLDKKDLLTNSKLLKFMLSDKYLKLQLYTFYECLDKVEVKEEITQEQLTYLTMELQKDTSKLLSYAEKCDLVKPWGISEILKMNPIGDDLDEENFTIECIAGCSIASNKLTSKAHKLEYYHELLDKLIARQIDEKKPIFEVIDKVNFYERRTNLFDGVIGMTEGDFENGSVVIF
jgi:hypothetical protein